MALALTQVVALAGFSHLTNINEQPFLERLTCFIKTSKQFNQSNLTSDIRVSTLMLSANGSLGYLES